MLIAAVSLLLSSSRGGFRAEQGAARVDEMLGGAYTARQASYDLRKLRGKQLVQKLPGHRTYEPISTDLRSLMALGVLRDRVLAPLLSGRTAPPTSPPRNTRGNVKQH